MGLLGDVVNSVPIVGHIKGIVHYACGDTERGDAAVWSATRTAVVLGAGVAGALAGPAGAVAAAAAAGAGMYIRSSITENRNAKRKRAATATPGTSDDSTERPKRPKTNGNQQEMIVAIDENSHQAISGSSGVTEIRINLAERMLLSAIGTGISADPRRTSLEAVFQESRLQQSYSIVTNTLASSERAPTFHRSATLEKKTCFSGKHSAEAVAEIEIQRLQGFSNSYGGLSNNDPNFNRNFSVGLRCDEDEEEDADEDILSTNLSTSKNGNCISSKHAVKTKRPNGSMRANSMSSKRNRKERYSCQVCRKMFPTPSNLAAHFRIHSGTKPFKCDLCSRSFRQKIHLQSHMRSIHKIIVDK
ncbi:zinc finger protein 770-like isoform X2 [Daphnia pulicaria]|uniref:zinc finger protein 770-like isoform X2 n=1 Tax=Daphnia pulicaria TaxID=35523 RepID=UPI001EEB0DFE|nr:zinc finger protein 770-like isoform X2 [Daphnia pulicaria]XP_046656467.1 zinc finger protein 770-like isoform X2 [Daphnia pulicaria]